MNRKSFIKKWAGFGMACLLYMLACVFLYIVQYRLYGNAIKTPLLYVIVFPAFACLGWIVNGGYPKDEAEEALEAAAEDMKGCRKGPDSGPKMSPAKAFFMRWKNNELSSGKKLSFFVSGVLLTVATVFLICALFMDPYTLHIYLYLGILAVVGGMCFWQPRRLRPLSVMACLSFGAIIGITLIFLGITSPMTVANGAKLLKSSGYDEIYYEKSASDKEILGQIFDDGSELLHTQTSGLGFYMYRCEKDGEAYGAAVSIADKRIVAAEPLDNESGLRFYMSFD